MTSELQSSIFLINSSNSNNTQFGTGFSIYQDEHATYLITCMHVVVDVGGPSQVRVRNCPAEVIASGSEGGVDDLAVLRVTDSLDASILKLSTFGEVGRPFIADGYQLFGKNFLKRPIKGNLGEQIVLESGAQTGHVIAWDLKVEGDYPLQRGYSGAPVIDKKSGAVFAIVSHRFGEGKKGVAISIAELQKIWDSMPPDLIDKPEDERTREPNKNKYNEDRLDKKMAKDFKNEVIEIYRKLKYDLKVDFEIDGKQIDFFAEKRDVGAPPDASTKIFAECRHELNDNEINDLLNKQKIIKQKYPYHHFMVVSNNCNKKNLETLKKDGIFCLPYSQLMFNLVPLDKYADSLIFEYETLVDKKWGGKDCFIRPDFETDITYKKHSALNYFDKWIDNKLSNCLVLLGDLGTGKTTLAQFLSYDLALKFRNNPLSPAPVLISLREVRKKVDLEGIIISHFKHHKLDIFFDSFNHLNKLGRIILFFDGFDEMADYVRRDVMLENFKQLHRATEKQGKVVLTCRTHYFTDRKERVEVMGEGPSIETELGRGIRQQPGTNVVYLREFNNDQIKTYLEKVVGSENVEEVWQLINQIRGLHDLAQRPLLLDMIVNCLPALRKKGEITEAELFSQFTDMWMERDETQQPFMDKHAKLAIMLEVSWKIWNENRKGIHWIELNKLLSKLIKDGVLECNENNQYSISRATMRGSFLKRDNDGNYSFMHRPFLEFFLGQKVYSAFDSSNEMAISTTLDTRRFDWGIIHFLCLLDKGENKFVPPLKKFLEEGYKKNVSENALQILYWSARIKCNMVKEITDIEKLRKETILTIPNYAKLSGAFLQDMTLEGVDLTGANLSKANLSRANLNSAVLTDAKLDEANMQNVIAQNLVAVRASFRKTVLNNTSFNAANLTECDFTGAEDEYATFINAKIINVKGLSSSKTIDPSKLQPVVQRGYGDMVDAMTYSPDGKLVAIGTAYGLIIIYLIRNCKIMIVLEGHADSVVSIAFSPDGKYIASGSWDNTIRLWDVEKGKTLHVMKEHSDRVLSLAFSPNGKTIASGGDDKTIRLWDVEKGKTIRVINVHKNIVMALAFSPDGRYIASGSNDKTIRLWDIINIENIKEHRVLEGHTESVTSIAFSPDGRYIASGSNDCTVRIWDEEKVEKQLFEKHTDWVRAVAFSPNGEILASGGYDKIVCLWNLKKSEIPNVLVTHRDWIRAVAFSSDGMHLASGSDDHTVQLWNIHKSKPMHVLEGHNDRIRTVAFSPNKKTIASGSWDNTIRLWDIQKGTCLNIFKGHKGEIWSVAFSPDGNILASGSSDRSIRLWDIKKGNERLLLKGHEFRVRSVAFSPDGNTLASGSSDRSIRLWDLRDPNKCREPRILKEHTNEIMCVAFSPDGTILASGSYDNTVRLLDVNKSKTLHVLEGHSDWVKSVAFSPDGKQIASGSDDNTVRVWDVEKGRCQALLEGPPVVLSVQFAPNNKYLIASGFSGRLQFWDHKKRETFLYRYFFGPGIWLDLLPDGRFNASPEAIRYLAYTELCSNKFYEAEELVKEFYNPQAVENVLALYS